MPEKMTKVSLNMCYVMGNVQRMGNRFFLGLASQLWSGWYVFVSIWTSIEVDGIGVDGMCSSLFGVYWRVPCCCSCLPLAFSWTKYNSKCVSWWHVLISIWTSVEVDGMCSSLFGRLLKLMACVHLFLDKHWSHFQRWSGAVPENKSGMSMRKES